MGVWVLFICSACYTLKISLSFVVTQSPGTVQVAVGDSFTVKCTREMSVKYCQHTSFWHKLNPRTGKLTDIFDMSEVKLEDGGLSCSLTISNATLQNSGIYYCSLTHTIFTMIGNGTRVIVTGSRQLNPSIIMYSPSDVVGPTVLLECLVKGVVPTQVRIAWIIDQSERTGFTESAWTENSDLAEECTRDTITISTKEWTRAVHVECVVEYDGAKISKILNRDGVDSVCTWLLHAGVGAAFLIIAATVTLAVCLYKDMQSATTVRSYYGKETQGKQNHGSQERLRPTVRSSVITEIEYSTVNLAALKST